MMLYKKSDMKLKKQMSDMFSSSLQKIEEIRSSQDRMYEKEAKSEHKAAGTVEELIRQIMLFRNIPKHWKNITV